MNTKFYVGQKVVCVDDKMKPGKEEGKFYPPLNKGKVYVIRGFCRPCPCYATLGAFLVGIKGDLMECYYGDVEELSVHESRLRPQEEMKQEPAQRQRIRNQTK